MGDKKKKIVMFEDDSFLSGMYRTKISMCGLDIKVYEYPPENVADVVLEEKPDLISMGVVMPRMDGFHATYAIKQDKRTKDIPLVFLTNLGQSEDITRGLELGATEYLVKAHYMPQQIVDIFNEIIAGSHKPIWTDEEMQKLKFIENKEMQEERKNQTIEPTTKKTSDKWQTSLAWAFVSVVVIGLLLVILA